MIARTPSTEGELAMTMIDEVVYLLDEVFPGGGLNGTHEPLASSRQGSAEEPQPRSFLASFGFRGCCPS
jgi:hypothetical protein